MSAAVDRFGSSVHLEPVGVDRIPAARRSLTCAVCRRRAAGACVQCQAAGCRTAFHATCVTAGGLYLKLERAPANGSRMNVRKTAFCAEHRPKEGSAAVQQGGQAEGEGKGGAGGGKKNKRADGTAPESAAPSVLPVPTVSQKWCVVVVVVCSWWLK